MKFTILFMLSMVVGCAGDPIDSTTRQSECGDEPDPATLDGCMCLGARVVPSPGNLASCNDDEVELAVILNGTGEALPVESSVCCLPE